MSAERLPWIDWYRAELANLRTLIATIPHPSGEAVCRGWLIELLDAAAHDQHAQAFQLGAQIRDRIALEKHWDREAKYAK